MADPNNNRNNNGSSGSLQQDLGSSTISYLPILFANGYPTSLEKMSIEQLELFIPFLIKCSLNLKTDEEPKKAPKWWPSNLEFSVPFAKPKDYRKVCFFSGFNVETNDYSEILNLFNFTFLELERHNEELSSKML